jgi:hypothetical protein
VSLAVDGDLLGDGPFEGHRDRERPDDPIPSYLPIRLACRASIGPGSSCQTAFSAHSSGLTVPGERRASAFARLVEPGPIGPGLSPMTLVPIGRGHRPDVASIAEANPRSGRDPSPKARIRFRSLAPGRSSFPDHQESTPTNP